MTTESEETSILIILGVLVACAFVLGVMMGYTLAGG